MNKPVNCGCGGEAEIVFDGNGEMSGVAVKCKKCGITTAYYLDDAQKAIETWNRAMGADVNSVVSVFSSEMKDE